MASRRRFFFDDLISVEVLKAAFIKFADPHELTGHISSDKVAEVLRECGYVLDDNFKPPDLRT